jgi:hypothetical protein
MMRMRMRMVVVVVFPLDFLSNRQLSYFPEIPNP